MTHSSKDILGTITFVTLLAVAATVLICFVLAMVSIPLAIVGFVMLFVANLFTAVEITYFACVMTGLAFTIVASVYNS